MLWESRAWEHTNNIKWTKLCQPGIKHSFWDSVENVDEDSENYDGDRNTYIEEGVDENIEVDPVFPFPRDRGMTRQQ